MTEAVRRYARLMGHTACVTHQGAEQTDLTPPETDNGSLPNLKFPFAMAHNRLEQGGWAREVTVRELPVARSMAGVDMRLEEGAVRELHWHKEAEWAYILEGNVRLTVVDADYNVRVDDLKPGDVWLVPAGIPHSIQGLAGGCEFLLVFDDGNFSENETLPGAMRELHWHPDADEWQYYLAGEARMTVFDATSKARTFNYQAGDVGFAPRTMGHYIENIGSTTVRVINVFNSPRYKDMSLRQWMALTPPALVRGHLDLDDVAIAALSRDRRPIVR